MEDFVPIQTDKPFVQIRMRSEKNLGGYLTAHSGDFTVFLSPKALRYMFHVAKKGLPHEVVGPVGGRVYKDTFGLYLIVTCAAVDDLAKSTGASVTTTHEGEIASEERLYNEDPSSQKSGWFHSHTGFGAFMSHTDAETQGTWPEEYHIGVVVDPLAGEANCLAIFHGPQAVKMTIENEPVNRSIIADSRDNSRPLAKSDPLPQDVSTSIPSPRQRSKPEVTSSPVATGRLIDYVAGFLLTALASAFGTILAITLHKPPTIVVTCPKMAESSPTPNAPSVVAETKTKKTDLPNSNLSVEPDKAKNETPKLTVEEDQAEKPNKGINEEAHEETDNKQTPRPVPKEQESASRNGSTAGSKQPEGNP
ncbi:MAG: hypothetical protein V1809_03945 [Planctomycetota bacterium]